MSSRKPDRQLTDARNAYVGAVRRLDKALQNFDHCGAAMDPGPGANPIPWTPEQWRIIRTVAHAFAAVVDARDTWDALRIEQRAGLG